jgi:hypothetical protein
MIRSLYHRSISILVGAILVSSCSDRAPGDLTGPQASAVGQTSGSAAIDSRHSGSSHSGVELQALWWNKHHKDVVSVSKRIDASGGVISIPATGLTMVFPAGAVANPTTITVTSDEKYVAYRMEPSGIHFNKDVVVTQLLSVTEVAGAPLRSQIFAAYIADDNVKLSGKVPVLELEPSTTSLSPLTNLPEAQVWLIRHFSRYMLASG